MNRQIFLAIFMMLIGVIGLIVGAATHHLTDSAAALAGYLLPIILGIIMIVVNRVGK